MAATEKSVRKQSHPIAHKLHHVRRHRPRIHNFHRVRANRAAIEIRSNARQVMTAVEGPVVRVQILRMVLHYDLNTFRLANRFHESSPIVLAGIGLPSSRTRREDVEVSHCSRDLVTGYGCDPAIEIAAFHHGRVVVHAIVLGRDYDVESLSCGSEYAFVYTRIAVPRELEGMNMWIKADISRHRDFPFETQPDVFGRSRLKDNALGRRAVFEAP